MVSSRSANQVEVRVTIIDAEFDPHRDAMLEWNRLRVRCEVRCSLDHMQLNFRPGGKHADNISNKL